MMKKFCIFLVLSIFILADCKCDTVNDDSNKSQALKYKVGVIASILMASAIGICISIFGRSIPTLHPDIIFFFFKAFFVGLILATEFIHVLLETFDNLTSPCLKEDPWGKFSFTGFMAMVVAIDTFSLDFDH